MTPKRKIDPALQSLLHELASTEMSEAQVCRALRAQKIERLRDGYRRLQTTDPAQFRPGDLVQWQPGLKYVKWPQYGEPAVVIECLDPPLTDASRESGSAYFRSPLTLVLGLQHKDGFHCWHLDGRRFELVARAGLGLAPNAR